MTCWRVSTTLISRRFKRDPHLRWRSVSGNAVGLDRISLSEDPSPRSRESPSPRAGFTPKKDHRHIRKNKARVFAECSCGTESGLIRKERLSKILLKFQSKSLVLILYGVLRTLHFYTLLFTRNAAKIFSWESFWILITHNRSNSVVLYRYNFEAMKYARNIETELHEFLHC